MRSILCFGLAIVCCTVVAVEKPATDVEQATSAAKAARQNAASEPTIRDANSPPVKAYLLEQQRRRVVRLSGLKQRLDEAQRDATKASLVPVMQQQLAELESKPPEQVSFDSAYGYEPTTGLVGYSKKVRLLENTADGKSIILVDNAALVIAGLGTSEYTSGKFFGIDKAILVGSARPDYIYRNSPKKCYNATLIDLEKLLADRVQPTK